MKLFEQIIDEEKEDMNYFDGHLIVLIQENEKFKAVRYTPIIGKPLFYAVWNCNEDSSSLVALCEILRNSTPITLLSLS